MATIPFQTTSDIDTVIEILLNSKDARLSVNNAKVYQKSTESKEILRTVEGLTYLLELKFLNAYKLFS